LHLSPLLDWYGDDWNVVGGYLGWLAELVEDETLKQRVVQAKDGSVNVVFIDYDWSLNGQESSGSDKTTEAPAASFGSGTVPNQ
jgi:hypothetical protein